MDYCPTCGGELAPTGEQEDVATRHLRSKCTKCGAEWVETVSKSGVCETLHICPVEGDK